MFGNADSLDVNRRINDKQLTTVYIMLLYLEILVFLIPWIYTITKNKTGREYFTMKRREGLTSLFI